MGRIEFSHAMLKAVQLILLVVGALSETSISVYYGTEGYSVRVAAVDKSAAAWSVFSDTLNVTGWGVLDVHTNARFYDQIQAYAAGVAEGYLTAARIVEHYTNMFKVTFPKGALENVTSFMASQDAWTRDQISQHKGDLYWEQVANVMAQFDGLMEGYQLAQAASPDTLPVLSPFAFQMLNGIGDLYQIIPAVEPSLRPKWDAMTASEVEDRLLKSGRCSAMIKVTGDLSKLYMGHSTWSKFSVSNRIYKHYHFAFSNPSTAAQQVSFPSYPGYIESHDDYYLMSSGLGMVETSLTFKDNHLYDLITPNSLLSWHRVRVASAMAHTGEEWYSIYKQHYSGTYSNQYMIVDFKKFTPGKALPDGLFWVVEEIPGHIPGADMTETLTRGYWPSYNVPYFNSTTQRAGYADWAASGVPSADYQTAPRATIFRRDEDTVTDMTTFQQLLRSNNYIQDPYSAGLPTHAICARDDLSVNGTAFGCHDTKVTEAAEALLMRTWAVNGPTIGNNLPAFTWSGRLEPHLGLPTTYPFSFVEMRPSL